MKDKRGFISLIVIFLTMLVTLGSIHLWHKSVLLSDLLDEWCIAKRQQYSIERVFSMGLSVVKEQFTSLFERAERAPLVRAKLSLGEFLPLKQILPHVNGFFITLKKVAPDDGGGGQAMKVTLKFRRNGRLYHGASCILSRIEEKKDTQGDACFAINYYTFGALL